MSAAKVECNFSFSSKEEEMVKSGDSILVDSDKPIRVECSKDNSASRLLLINLIILIVENVFFVPYPFIKSYEKVFKLFLKLLS